MSPHVTQSRFIAYEVTIRGSIQCPSSEKKGSLVTVGSAPQTSYHVTLKLLVYSGGSQVLLCSVIPSAEWIECNITFLIIKKPLNFSCTLIHIIWLINFTVMYTTLLIKNIEIRLYVCNDWVLGCSHEN